MKCQLEMYQFINTVLHCHSKQKQYCDTRQFVLFFSYVAQIDWNPALYYNPGVFKWQL